MTERINKVNELIKHELSRIIEKDIVLPPGTFCTISEVESAADLKTARVWVSVFPPEKRDEALKIIKANIYEIQGELNHRTKMRYTPRISFLLDKSAENASKVEELLKQIKL